MAFDSKEKARRIMVPNGAITLRGFHQKDSKGLQWEYLAFPSLWLSSPFVEKNFVFYVISVLRLIHDNHALKFSARQFVIKAERFKSQTVRGLCVFVV